MMDRESKKLENHSKIFQLCKNNCGFYANALYDGLCIKCHENKSSGADYRGSIYSNVTCRSVAKNITQRMGETPMQSDVDDCLSAPGELADQDCNDCCDQFEYDKSQIIPETDSNCECLEQIPTNVEEEQRPAEIPAEIQVEILVEIPSNTPQQRLENLEKPEKPKDVCVFCSKKMPYSGIKCKCENYYCFTHRLPEEHGCTFDYRSIGKMAIQKNNPKVAFDKIRKL